MALPQFAVCGSHQHRAQMWCEWGLNGIFVDCFLNILSTINVGCFRTVRRDKCRYGEPRESLVMSDTVLRTVRSIVRHWSSIVLDKTVSHVLPYEMLQSCCQPNTSWRVTFLAAGMFQFSMGSALPNPHLKICKVFFSPRKSTLWSNILEGMLRAKFWTVPCGCTDHWHDYICPKADTMVIYHVDAKVKHGV